METAGSTIVCGFSSNRLSNMVNLASLHAVCFSSLNGWNELGRRLILLGFF